MKEIKEWKEGAKNFDRNKLLRKFVFKPIFGTKT